METKYFLDAPECLKLLGFEKFFDNFLRFMGYTKTNHIANADKIFLVICTWINESERSKKLSEINAEKSLLASVDVITCSHCKNLKGKTIGKMRIRDFEKIIKPFIQVFPNRLRYIERHQNLYKFR